MPYCTSCGTQIDAKWTFCHICGKRQLPDPPSGAQYPPPRPPEAPPPPQAGPQAPPTDTDFLRGMSDRNASTLCYVPIFGIIPAIIFLAASRFRSHATVRFDAFQSLYLFVAWLIISSAMPALIPGFGFFRHGMAELAKLGMIILYIRLLIRANRGVPTRIPVIGDLAARSAAEQL